MNKHLQLAELTPGTVWGGEINLLKLVIQKDYSER